MLNPASRGTPRTPACGCVARASSGTFSTCSSFCVRDRCMSLKVGLECASGFLCKQLCGHCITRSSPMNITNIGHVNKE